MEKRNSSRNPSLDIVRVFAFASVVSVHFFLNSGYYQIFVRGSRMYVATLIRTFFMICVPLFLVLSGYLMNRKTPTRQYYQKLTRIIGEYVLACVCCIVYNAITKGTPNGIAMYLKQAACSLISYQAAPYDWYVEMYIGLFLLIPFLNVVYHQMKDEKGKRQLVLTMLVLTAVPSIGNLVSVDFPDYTHTLTIFPQWWIGFYPITYYFIGAYLSEYPINIGKAKLLLLIAVTDLIAGSYSYWMCSGDVFVWGNWQSYESAFTVIQTVLVFSFLTKIPCRTDGIPAKIFAYLSDLSFSAYLVSSIFDDIIYKTSGLFENQHVYRLHLFAVTVPAAFACSMALAAVIHMIYNAAQKTVTGLHKRKAPAQKA